MSFLDVMDQVFSLQISQFLVVLASQAQPQTVSILCSEIFFFLFEGTITLGTRILKTNKQSFETVITDPMLFP